MDRKQTRGQIYTRRHTAAALADALLGSSSGSTPSASSSATPTPVVTPTGSILVISDYFSPVQETKGKTQEEIEFEDVVDFVAAL